MTQSTSEYTAVSYSDTYDVAIAVGHTNFFLNMLGTDFLRVEGLDSYEVEYGGTVPLISIFAM